MPLSGKFAKDAETFCSASTTLDHISGRLQPSQGGRRTVWWNGRGEDTTATPPQKQHNDKAAAGRGMAPSSHGRVYLNGIDSYLYVHLRPSASPCTTTSFRRRRRRPRTPRRAHPKWPLPGLSWSPGLSMLSHRRCNDHLREVHPTWPLPGISKLQRRNTTDLDGGGDAHSTTSHFFHDREGRSAQQRRRGIAGTLWDPSLTYGGAEPRPFPRLRKLQLGLCEERTVHDVFFF